MEALPDTSAVDVELGGVGWTGPAASGYRANLWLRIATRVLARVGEVEAREFGKLRRRAERLPWRAVRPAAARRSRCAPARPAAASTTRGRWPRRRRSPIADAVPGVHACATDEAPAVTLLLRGVQDRFTFSADASGERLHRRGARVETGDAPLRETLAAGLLALAGWTPGTALCDPMCGAGTIVIEAAMQAAGRAPGTRARLRDRELAAAGRAGDARARSPTLRAEADAGVRQAASASAPIIGSDRDPRTIESARRNAERGGVAAHVTFACRDAADARPPAPTGLVITNPPYGHRLGDARAAARGYRDLGGVLRAHFRGWRVAVVAPARLDVARAMGLRSAKQFALRNGGLPIVLHVATLT